MNRHQRKAARPPGPHLAPSTCSPALASTIDRRSSDPAKTLADSAQREGRVHRFKGHALRKNVGATHRADALRSREPDPWSAAFAAAELSRGPELNDLWPWWTYPGDSKIERSIPSSPLAATNSGRPGSSGKGPSIASRSVSPARKTCSRSSTSRAMPTTTNASRPLDRPSSATTPSGYHVMLAACP